MAKISRDLSAGNLHPREDLFASGNIAALNGVVTCSTEGCSTVSISITGTYVGILNVEGTIDGVNWDQIPVRPVNQASYAVVLASGASGRWQGSISQFSQVRVRMTSYTSGSASAFISSSIGVNSVEAILRATDQHLTATGLVGAAVTLTIPGVANGQFHYFSRLTVQRFAVAALTAGTTPVIVTTTNLPGARSFSIAADAAAQGTIYSETLEAGVPFRSTAGQTATTFVAPATPNVIWRLSADYYIGS